MADIPPESEEALKRLGAALAASGYVIMTIAEFEELRRFRAKAAADELTRESERLGEYEL